MKYLEKVALIILFSIAFSMLLSVATIITAGSAFSIGAIAEEMSFFIFINLPVILAILFVELTNERLKRRFMVKNWTDLTIDKKLISIGWKVALGKIILWLFIFMNIETLTKSA